MSPRDPVVLGPGVDLVSMNPDTLASFRRLASDYMTATGKRIQVNSAYRSHATQAALYTADPVKNAAPGKSMHQYGFAFDIQSDTAADLERLGLLSKHGFWRPLMAAGVVNREPWHIEPVGLKYSAVRGAVSVLTLILLGVCVWWLSHK
jgi:hypothetical protein